MGVATSLMGEFLTVFGGWIVALFIGTLFMLFLFLTKGASVPLFKARISGKALVLLQRKDERYGLVTGDYSAGGVDLGKWGIYLCSKGSFKPFAGTVLAQALEGFGAIPTSEYVHATNELKKEGYNNLEEILADEERLQAIAEGEDGSVQTEEKED